VVAFDLVEWGILALEVLASEVLAYLVHTAHMDPAYLVHTAHMDPAWASSSVDPALPATLQRDLVAPPLSVRVLLQDMNT